MERFLFGWLLLGTGIVLAVAFVVYLIRERPGKPLKVEPETCCFCGKEEKTRFFCKSCYGRMIWRYAAILSGIGWIPVAVLAGFLIHTLTGSDLGNSIGISALVGIGTYLTITFSYFRVYSGDGINILTVALTIALLPLLLVGVPVGFSMKIGPGPGKIHFTFREEYWRFRLLLKQLRGKTKVRAAT